MSVTEAQKRATIKHRKARIRVEVVLDPRSDEARALHRLVEDHGTVSAAVRFALLKA